jgi:CRP/FNR family transcriptional regulator
MSREEIGSLLGLKLETVSRAFSKLHANGVLSVHQRHIEITDMNALHHVLEGVAIRNGV